ncbi:MAG: SCO family protein [Flavobacteriaceae bacterium]
MPTTHKHSRKMTILWISAIVLIFGTIVIPSIAKRLKSDQVVDINRMAMTQDVMYSESKLSYIIGEDGPRKVPYFDFVDQNGNAFSAESLMGKITVVDFFFTTCPTICPIMSSNLSRLANTFNEYPNVQFVSISINPRYDTVDRLAVYKEKYNAATKQWYLLNGPVQEVYGLARDGFFMIAKEDDEAPGGFEHSGLFALIDSNGYLRSSTDGFGNPLIYYRATITPEEKIDENGEEEQITLLTEDINRLIKETHGNH